MRKQVGELRNISTHIPNKVLEGCFSAVWLALSIAGAITAIYEFKNNKVFAIPVAGLTSISLLLCIFSYGISNM